MKREFYYPSKDKRTQIHAIEWIPDTEVRGVLQIAHGMVEFIDRYDRFATFMASKGFYVVGNDHLGHGKSVTDEKQLGFFAEKEGNLCVIGDMQQLREDTRKKYPDVPYFLLGHSMGSFLTRQYIEVHGDFNPRGGISIIPFANWGDKDHQAMVNARLLSRLK